MKKFLVALLTISMLICGTQFVAADEATESKDFKVGITCKDLTIQAYAAITGYMEQYFKEAGIECTLLSADSDPATMVNHVENFVTANMDVIIIIEPIDSNSLTAPIQEANAAGVKVLSYAFESEGAYTNLICDNYKVGYETARQLVDWAKAERPDKVVQIGLLTLDISNAEAKKRRDGAVDALEELYSGQYEIVSEQKAQMTEEGANLSQNIMQANPELDAFICNSGSAAIGANESIKAEGALDQIRIFTCDSTPDILKCVYNADKNAIKSCVCVGADTFMAQKMFDLCVMMRDGEECEKLYMADVESIDQSNVEEFAAHEGYELT